MTFSTISYEQLKALAGLTEIVDDVAFADWQALGARPSTEEGNALRQLIDWHRVHLESYTEEEVKMKVIGPLIALVNFRETGLTEWYERPIQAEIQGELLTGKADFILARGEKEPVPPYFLIQEYKPEFSQNNPEIQLVAELLAALSFSPDRSAIYGAYSNGGSFRMVKLVRNDPASQGTKPTHTYMVSRRYDSMHLPDLEALFSFLSAVKKLV